MKCLVLTNEYPPTIYGGAGVHVDYLTRELAKMMRVEVRCFGDSGRHVRVHQPGLLATEFGVDGAPYGAPKHLQSVFSALQRCLDWNSAGIDADIVHLHTWYTHLGGVLAKLNYGIPLVLTVHSLEPLRPWKREQLGGGYDFSCWIERTAIAMADAVVAVSSDTKADILRFFDVPEEKIRVIHNGIDLEEYRYRPNSDVLSRYGIREDVPFVLFVGRITRQKGILYLANAIRHIDPKFQVVLCAGAPDTKEIASEMRAVVTEVQRTRGNVVWIESMVSREEAIALYSHAALFCCPSVYEPFGIINLEAMACDTPVVASAIGGIPEVVVDGETGTLVPLELRPGSFEPRDASAFERALADAINGLLHDPVKRVRMAKAGRSRVEKFFSWSSVAAKTRDLYAEILGGNTRGDAS
jgi:starch synthase